MTEDAMNIVSPHTQDWDMELVNQQRKLIYQEQLEMLRREQWEP